MKHVGTTNTAAERRATTISGNFNVYTDGSASGRLLKEITIELIPVHSNILGNEMACSVTKQVCYENA